MKKIIPIFFLVIIIFSQPGYYIISLVRQHLAKEAMKEQLLAGLPESSLKVFDAEANSKYITWEEDGKEFSLDGKMYDVAKIKIISGKKYLYCISDNKEDQVLQTRSDAVKSSIDQSSGNHFNSHTVKFLMNECTVPFKDNMIVGSANFTTRYARIVVAVCSTTKNVITPPPNFIQCSQNNFL